MTQYMVPTFPVVGTAPRRQPKLSDIWKPSPLLDFFAVSDGTGVDYVRDAAGKVILADPYTAWRQWCLLAMQVPQARHPIYPRRFGFSLDPMFRARPRAIIEADIQHRVRYLLTQFSGGRTKDVVDFAFSWAGQGVEVACTPVPSTPAPPGASFQVTRRYPNPWI